MMQFTPKHLVIIGHSFSHFSAQIIRVDYWLYPFSLCLFVLCTNSRLRIDVCLVEYFHSKVIVSTFMWYMVLKDVWNLLIESDYVIWKNKLISAITKPFEILIFTKIYENDPYVFVAEVYACQYMYPQHRLPEKETGTKMSMNMTVKILDYFFRIV